VCPTRWQTFVPLCGTQSPCPFKGKERGRTQGYQLAVNSVTTLHRSQGQQSQRANMAAKSPAALLLMDLINSLERWFVFMQFMEPTGLSIPILMNAQQGELERGVDQGEDRSDAWGKIPEGRTNKKCRGKASVSDDCLGEEKAILRGTGCVKRIVSPAAHPSMSNQPHGTE
ncbi:Nonribosomal peptide synthetase 32, partial [Dissostichus eleginoides]